jgi:hypothetical protein
MKQFITFFLFITLTSCSHYKPVQMKSGKPSGQELSSCSFNVFGFPTNANALRIDKTLSKFNVEESEIYTIEMKSWAYLWPIASKQCTVITLNTTYKKTQTSTKNQSTQVKAISPFDHLNNPSQCRRYIRTTRDRCIMHFRSIEKD